MAQQQINCPNCGSPAAANIVQLIDVDQYPQLKQMLIAGQLNVAQCQNCDWSGQVASPLIYHDSAHDMLISFVPMELNLPYDQQERMMGQMVRAVVDQIPAEKRRAYLLQPKQMMRWQTFIEAVLETEGITKDMIERQRKQSELLQKLMGADNDVVDYLLQDPANKRLVDDEAFVGMVQTTLQQAVQSQQPTAIIVSLSNLQARLMSSTAAGQRIEKRQMAMHALQLDAKEAGGMTVEILAEHVVRNQADDEVIDGMVAAVGGLNYDFFSAFSKHIDSAVQDGDKATVDRLTAIRTRLLEVFDEMREASAQMVKESLDALNRIAAAPDKMLAIQQHATQIDDVFMSLLERELEQARGQGNLDRVMALKEVEKLITDIMNQANPPHLQLISMMMQAETPEQAIEALASNPELIGPELIEAVDQVFSEMPEEAPQDFIQRLEQVKKLIVGVVNAQAEN